MISKVFINYYLIWIFLILVLGFSLFSFLKNINELNSKTSFLGKDYKKIEISNLNNINNKNLILIYVESLDQNFRNFDNQNLLPSFSKLQTQYLNVNKFEQLKSIDWTIAGIFSSQCGIPLIDYSVLNKNINCLPDILKKNSYKNFFVIGHESKFQNLNTFLSNHNYDKIIDKKFIETNYNYVNQNTGWGNGFNDNVLFEVVHDTIKQNNKNNFFISILTSNTHGPLGEMQKDCRYKYNIQSLEESILCFDKKLSNFLNILIENYLDNTVIVVISDHLMLNGMRYYKKYFSENTRYLTNSFISKSLKMDKFIKNRETMNHYDLLPTILNLTNVYEGSDVALGISLLNENYSEEEAKKRNSFLDKTNYSLKEYNEILQ